MGDLKPIGSEKLKGQDKIKRIMEIARFNEVIPTKINETAKSEYSVGLADGNNYEIVKERQGYIIKKTINESETDYIEPMKNRKYYSSYSQAFKRLNLLAGELNRLNENDEGVSLYGEQKKFILRTPKSKAPDAEVQAPAAEPPAVPEPELPPADDVAMGDEMGAEMGAEMGSVSDEMGPEGGEEEMGAEIGIEEPSAGEEEQVTFKSIQKLTGKLTQKIRTLTSDQGMTSEDIKYVINMVLSSLDLNSLSEEDKEDIMSKFDEESEDLGADDMDGADMTDDSEVEDIQADMDVDIDSDAGDMAEMSHGAIIDSIFGESKVDRVLSKYFEVTKNEIRESKERKAKRIIETKSQIKSKMKSVIKLCETIEQELASKKFLEENINSKFLGLTNKNNLVFESKGKQIKISPEGLVL